VGQVASTGPQSALASSKEGEASRSSGTLAGEELGLPTVQGDGDTQRAQGGVGVY